MPDKDPLVALDYLPECKERGCVITMTDDIQRMQVVYQHGERPEAVCFVDRVQRSGPVPPWEAARIKVRAFVEACHRYEDEQEGY